MKRKRKDTETVVDRTLSKRSRAGQSDGFTNGEEDELAESIAVNGADRSARRKSSRRIIERTIREGRSDDESSEDDLLARQIWDEDEQDAASDAEEDDELAAQPETPSKKARGRPKGSRNKRQETPPGILPPHEKYFWDNRPGGSKTSHNTLSSHLLLNHDDYYEFKQSYHDPHESSVEFLLSLHQGSFPQWDFELANGFNLCLYGYGSKRSIIQAYAEHIHEQATNEKKSVNIIMVNGFETGISLQDILNPLASTLFAKHLKLPAQPAALLQLILERLDEKPPAERSYILINSLDAQSMRRPAIQSSLATLAAHPSIRICSTCDTPNFPLLWDVSLKRQFRFLFHDCTTFEPFDREIDVVESVNSLLGRSGRRIGGRDGVGYVLRSLPENARSLYRILVAEQLAAASLEDGVDLDGDIPVGSTENGVSGIGEGVEFRVLYHKAREELVCSTEHQFRALLKEFYDHQMIENRRDTLGTERLTVPFRKEELEGLLEDLVE